MFALLSTLCLAQTTSQTWIGSAWLTHLVTMRIALDIQYAIRKDGIEMDIIHTALSNHFDRSICEEILAQYELIGQ